MSNKISTDMFFDMIKNPLNDDKISDFRFREYVKTLISITNRDKSKDKGNILVKSSCLHCYTYTRRSGDGYFKCAVQGSCPGL